MRYRCHFIHKDSDERKEVVVALTAPEIESVDSLRRHKGTETADVSAAAYAMRHAYSEINPHAWRHVEAPTLIQNS